MTAPRSTGTSLRERSAAETLAVAGGPAAECGVVRVFDMTSLDILGIPVASAVRPFARTGSLCVHAGKGVTLHDALAGATMEAIEFAVAERVENERAHKVLTVAEILAQPSLADVDWQAFAPLAGRSILSSSAIDCVLTTPLGVEGEDTWLPLELIGHPVSRRDGRTYSLGTTTCGLASGNSPTEAIVHGLLEVAEHHIRSFNFFEDRSDVVDLASALPDPVRELADTVQDSGLELVLRHTSNDLGLPYFDAFILEPTMSSTIAISAGSGCHLLPEIAATRAVTEAAQCRLTRIHGGRDDLTERYGLFPDREAERRGMEEMRSRILARPRLGWDAATAPSAHLDGMPDDLDGARSTILSAMTRAGLGPAFTTTLSPEHWPVSVVRVVVARAENFTPAFPRLGPALGARALELTS